MQPYKSVFQEMEISRSDFRQLCLSRLNTLLNHFVKCVVFPNNSAKKKWISEIANYLDEIKIKIYPNKKYPTSQEYKKILYDSWSDNETKLLNIQSLIFDEYENLTNSEDVRKLGFEELQNKAKLFFEFVCEELGSNKPLNIDDLKKKLNTYL